MHLVEVPHFSNPPAHGEAPRPGLSLPEAVKDPVRLTALY